MNKTVWQIWTRTAMRKPDLLCAGAGRRLPTVMMRGQIDAFVGRVDQIWITLRRGDSRKVVYIKGRP